MTRAAAATSLLDQAQAATDHAHGILHNIAIRCGGRETWRTPGKVSTALAARMQTRMLTQAEAGVPTLCEHLSFVRPAPSYWLAYAPGKLRCGPCAQRAARRIRGTSEDQRCDHCRRPARPGIHPAATALPAMVVDIAPMPLTGLPPIVLMFGLCGPCKALDGEPERDR